LKRRPNYQISIQKRVRTFERVGLEVWWRYRCDGRTT
jgi:hypothetical protein